MIRGIPFLLQKDLNELFKGRVFYLIVAAKIGTFLILIQNKMRA